MKKIFFISLFSIGLFGFDISVETDLNRTLSNEKELSNSHSESREKQSSVSSSKRKEDSISTTLNLSLLFADQLNMRCTNRIYNSMDLGITFVNKVSRTINYNKKEYLSAGAAGAMSLKDLGISDKKIKEYISCLIDAGAYIAQGTIDFNKNVNKRAMSIDRLADEIQAASIQAINLKNKEIRVINENAKKALTDDCYFYGSQDVITCGKLILHLTNMSPAKLTYLNHNIYGAEGSLYGVSTSYQANLTDGTSRDTTVTASMSETEDTVMKKSSSSSKSSSSKNSSSVGKFIPN